MKAINNFISEKLIINKNISVQTENVLVVPVSKLDGWPVGYDRPLISTALENISKQYDFDDVIFKIEGNQSYYYSFYNKIDLRIRENELKEIIGITVFDGQKELQKTQCAKKLIKTITSSTREYLVFHTTLSSLKYNFLYLWFSKSNQCLEILLSNKEYKELKNKKRFI